MVEACLGCMELGGSGDIVVTEEISLAVRRVIGAAPEPAVAPAYATSWYLTAIPACDPIARTAMDLNQAAKLLGWSRDQVRDAITIGVTPAGATAAMKLRATAMGKRDFDIDDEALDDFLLTFDAAEPGRFPPVAVRRQLFIEAREQCCFCGETGPFEFHHLLDWARLKRHDPEHMVLICRNCHGKCTNGSIDRQRQRAYKMAPYWKAKEEDLFTTPNVEIMINWDDLHEVITHMHGVIGRDCARTEDPGYDYTYIDVERKNELNRLSSDYYDTWRRAHEPKFFIIKEFLGSERAADDNSTIQELYFEVVGDLRDEIAAIQSREPEITFEDVARRVFRAAFAALSSKPKFKRDALRTIVAFMYFECDIGRKPC
jgi:hypothetical protein